MITWLLTCVITISTGAGAFAITDMFQLELYQLNKLKLKSFKMKMLI